MRHSRIPSQEAKSNQDIGLADDEYYHLVAVKYILLESYEKSLRIVEASEAGSADYAMNAATSKRLGNCLNQVIETAIAIEAQSNPRDIRFTRDDYDRLLTAESITKYAYVKSLQNIRSTVGSIDAKSTTSKRLKNCLKQVRKILADVNYQSFADMGE